jgi:hypothetical protein
VARPGDVDRPGPGGARGRAAARRCRIARLERFVAAVARLVTHDREHAADHIADDEFVRLRSDHHRACALDELDEHDELEELDEISEGNASIKSGDWMHRITPTISNLSKRAGKIWKQGLLVVGKRYQKHLEATPLERLQMEHAEEEIEVDVKYEKVRNVITEMLLRAIPKNLAAEAITKRLDNPLKITLLIVIKYQPGGRKEREAILTQITNPEACWSEDKALEGIRTWKRRIERAKELNLVLPDQFFWPGWTS